jgi:Tfp pilus assembly protein PilV
MRRGMSEAMCLMSITRTSKSKRQKAILRRRGLSIIEVALASALLVVAMVPILKSLTKAHMFASMIEEKTQGLVLAQGKLDKIRAISIYDFDSLSPGSSTETEGSYICNIVVEATANPDLKQITVSVSRDGRNSVTLATYVARRWL